MPSETLVPQQKLFSRQMLRKLILPLIIEQFLAMAVGMADTVMVTSAGEAAVSGISLVDSINILLIQIFSALATGGAVVVSQYLGRQEHKNARTAAKQLIYTSTLLSLILMALALFFQKGILQLVFGSIEADVMENALTYFWLSAISYPFLAIYNSIAALYRSMGNSKVSMLTSLLMNVVNIGGNAILIFGCGWGVAGAATASLVSRALAAGVMLILIRSHNNMIYVDGLLHFEYKPQMVKSIMKVGIPNGLENGMFQIGKLMVQGLIALFGTSAIAANAIVNSVTSVINVPGLAIGLAMITVIGQCVGADAYDQAVYYTRRLMGLIYAAMAAMNLIIFALAYPLVGMFNLSPEATTLAIQILQIFCVVNALLWPIAFPFANVLRAAGDAKFTMVASVISMWIFRIGFSYILAQGFNMGLQGVWYAMYIDWAVRAIIFWIRYKSGRWKTKRVI